MGYVERHLLPNERVLYKTRLHGVRQPASLASSQTDREPEA